MSEYLNLDTNKIMYGDKKVLKKIEEFEEFCVKQGIVTKSKMDSVRSFQMGDCIKNLMVYQYLCTNYRMSGER